jgi:hypothetical protein
MPADAPGRGYGRELIERALAYTAQAKTQLTFGPDGVTCRIEMPLPARAAASGHTAMAGERVQVTASHAPDISNQPKAAVSR